MRANPSSIPHHSQVLPGTAPHRTLCTMRGISAESSSSSAPAESREPQPQQQALEGTPLVEVVFKAHAPHEAASNPRVPEGITTVRFGAGLPGGGETGGCGSFASPSDLPTAGQPPKFLLFPVTAHPVLLMMLRHTKHTFRPPTQTPQPPLPHVHAVLQPGCAAPRTAAGVPAALAG